MQRSDTGQLGFFLNCKALHHRTARHEANLLPRQEEAVGKLLKDERNVAGLR